MEWSTCSLNQDRLTEEDGTKGGGEIGKKEVENMFTAKQLEEPTMPAERFKAQEVLISLLLES